MRCKSSLGAGEAFLGARPECRTTSALMSTRRLRFHLRAAYRRLAEEVLGLTTGFRAHSGRAPSAGGCA